MVRSVLILLYWLLKHRRRARGHFACHEQFVPVLGRLSNGAGQFYRSVNKTISPGNVSEDVASVYGSTLIVASGSLRDERKYQVSSSMTNLFLSSSTVYWKTNLLFCLAIFCQLEDLSCAVLTSTLIHVLS